MSTPNDYIYFNYEYTVKILKELNIKNIGRSRIDYSVYIYYDEYDYSTPNLISLFFYSDNLRYRRFSSEKLHNILSLDNEEIDFKDYYILKLTNFSNNNWRNYKKVIRKIKINKLKECQKYS